MKKIQISTEKKLSDVQVIFLNAYFIAKALRAQIALESILNVLKESHIIIECYDIKRDEDGKEMCDEYGKPVMEFKGFTYESKGTTIELPIETIITLNENINGFLKELTNAFEE